MVTLKYVLLDIEGTVCPISFVKETLFPYAIKALPSVLARKWDHADFQQYRDAFPEEYRSSPEVLQAHVEDLTQRDVKIACLKNLQGYLWEDGYKTGAYSTPLFPDVKPELRQWKKDGVQIAIYSSGSVLAQKLLFAHVKVDVTDASRRKQSRDEVEGEDDFAQPASKRGPLTSQAAKATSELLPDKRRDEAEQVTWTEDLTELIKGWFDTTNAGPKSEASSYTRIADTLKWKPSDVLFLSDNVKEVDAAIKAGMTSLLVDRPGNAPVTEADRERLEIVSTFENLKLGGITGEDTDDGSTNSG